MDRLTKITILSLILLTLPVFQNCSGVSYNTPPVDSPAGSPSSPDQIDNQFDDGIVSGPGVDGGHFDLDTSTEVYEDGDGKTNHHEHEWDDKHETNTVDFFNMLDSKFDEVNEAIMAGQEFYIVVANGDLSSRVALQINGQSYRVDQISQPLGPFLIGNSGVASQMLEFKAIVATDAILNKGLVSSQTSCVKDNDFSADGRYRNGALVIQAILASQIGQLNASTGVASNDSALLWESTLFWHESGGHCR